MVICWLFVILTTASFAVHFYYFSMAAFYWQTLALVKNIALYRAVRSRRGGYLVPWLVVVCISLLALPMLFIFEFFVNLDEGEDLAAALWLTIGFAICKYCRSNNNLIIAHH